MKIIKCIYNVKLTGQIRCISFEGTPRGIPRDPPKNLKEWIERIINNQKKLPKALKLSFQDFKKEITDKLSSDVAVDHLSYKYIAKFREMSDEEIDKWSVTTDKVNQGLSTASFVKHPERGTGVFSGHLDTTVPKTGDIVRSGLASFRSPNKHIFGMSRNYSFFPYNHFIIKYRGDGRTYGLNFHMNHKIDIKWHDLHMFPLYTRGGPYWQTAKIPFHKFYLTSKGRIQDQQYPFDPYRIRHISIALMDQVTGEFNFEVDYMGLSKEASNNDIFSYEMYTTPSREHRFK